MPINVCIFDIDDTIFDVKTKKFMPKSISAIKRLQEKGIKVILATGRPPLSAKAIFQEGVYPEYIVCSNGHIVLDNVGNIIESKTFNFDIVNDIYDYCMKNDIGLLFKYPYRIYEYIYKPVFETFYNKTKDSKNNVIKDDRQAHCKQLPNAGCLGCDNIKREAFNRYFVGKCIAVKINDESSDLLLCNVSKKSGVESVLKRLNVGSEECMAFGDNDNDIEICSFVGMGIAMGYASEGLKKVCKYITSDIENGVINALNHFELL